MVIIVIVIAIVNVIDFCSCDDDHSIRSRDLQGLEIRGLTR